MFTEESLIAKDNNVSSFQHLLPVAVAIQIKGGLKLKIFTVAFKGDTEGFSRISKNLRLCRIISGDSAACRSSLHSFQIRGPVRVLPGQVMTVM